MRMEIIKLRKYFPATAHNSRHTAPLRSAQIQPNGWTSYVHQSLGDIASLKGGYEI